MSRRSDLYAIDLRKFTSFLRSPQAIDADLLQELAGEDQAGLLESIRTMQALTANDCEPADVIALVSRLAHVRRVREVEEAFDWGHVMNKLDSWLGEERLRGEERRVARFAIRGRPLLGGSMSEGWNAYAWISPMEVPTFRELVRRPHKDSQLNASPDDVAWVDGVLARKPASSSALAEAMRVLPSAQNAVHAALLAT